MTCDETHPDNQYASEALSALEASFGVKIESHFFTRNGVNGDELVSAFYREIRQWTDSIITGDGVDEFMAGYYGHQQDPSEAVYYQFLRNLQEMHLAPLDANSGDTKLYVPYIDPRFISLMAQIPLCDKVGPQGRKLMMMAMARGKVPDGNIDRRKYGFGTRV